MVTPPSTPGTIWFLMRMLANVPRIMISWLPRRVPYWLKSITATPWSVRYLPAGEAALIEPAGEMWSVVIEVEEQAEHARVVDVGDRFRRRASWSRNRAGSARRSSYCPSYRCRSARP